MAELAAGDGAGDEAEELAQHRRSGAPHGVAHHVEEEETELFPKLIREHVDLRALEAPMAERKETLTGQTTKPV